jgi:glycosyltransferase involved in cell wall biosynthesis
MRHVLRRLIPGRLRPFARTLYQSRQRVVYVALAVVLAVGLGVAIATRSWAAAIAILFASLGGVTFQLVRVWRDHNQLSERHDELSGVAGRLALAQLDPDLPAELVPHAVRGLLDRGDVLDAYRLVTTRATMTAIDPITRRRLWSELQARGYLRHALAVAEVCLGDRDGRLHRLAHAKLKGEIAVLSGGSAPAAPRRRYTPVAGRVLHVVGNSLPTAQTGYTLRTHYTAMAQVAAGVDAHVVTQMGYATDRFWRSRRRIDGVTYHRVPGPPRGSLPLDRWLARHTDRTADLVAALRPAVLHAASDYLNAVTALDLGRRFGIPVVYESRGFWEETWLSRQVQTFGWDLARLEAAHGLPDAYLWRRDTEDRCRREADRVVTLADVMAQRIAAGGVAEDRVSVIPNAVDVDAFPVQTRDRGLATKLGIADEVTVIGYISSLVEYEGIDDLIRAYAAVRAGAPTPVALLIVGDGVEREPLMRHAQGLGLTDVIFTGRVPHDRVLDYYGLIDVFVVPRKPVEVCHLVTPLKPFEAFATGRTVVLSNVRALAAIAAQSQAAELFEAGDPDSLAATLMALLNDEPRRKDLASAGADWVRAHRTWAANAAAYVRLYTELGAR